MSGDVAGELEASEGWLGAGQLLSMPLRRQKLSMEEGDGRSSPIGREPSFRMAVMSRCGERRRSRWGSGDTSGKGSSGVPTGGGCDGNGAWGPYR